ncbi:MAG: PTH1 family peptidyl-tRNA hydrolase [Verrucomicrobiales bacterium]|jgi:PTH1 family peptidyl-tRNA hydrolase
MFGRKSSDRTGTPADLLIVGLGNPGDQYDGTRHNVGAGVVELLAARHGATLKPSKQAARLAELRIESKLVVVAFPQTFMNDSGRSVRDLVKRYGIADIENLLVIHDELDLEVGSSKLKVGGGLAGHNGLKSMKQHLHTQDFLRLRIGIGRPPGRQSVSDFVLRRPGKVDRVELDIEIERSADVLPRLLSEDINNVMNDFNK